MEFGMAQAIRSFKDLTTWQIAKELCVTVYKETKTFPSSEQFGLMSQMRRAAVSVPSNVAEGFGRQTAKEKQQFYHHSLGSLYELETQIELAHEFAYLNTEVYKAMSVKLEYCRRLLLALLNANRAKISNRKSPITNP